MGMVLDAPIINAESVARVLSEIAEIASETLELQDVFGRVATSVRRVVPFDHMGVIRILDGDRAVKHAATFDCPAEDAGCLQPCPLSSWSPRLRPQPGPIPRIDDARAELDPTFPGDADILAGGVRSAMWEPFHTGDVFRGGVWLSAERTHAFSEEHQQVLRPSAALLGSAVEHWRIWDAERRRRERLDKVETLMGTLAESLDIRQVFERLSQAIQPILEHDLLALSELDVRERTILVTACAGEADIPVPTEPIRLSDAEVERRAMEFEIERDLQDSRSRASARDRLLVSTGMRSWIRVPVRLSGEVRASLSFFHRGPSRFDDQDAEVARRIADRIALMLSHQRLAEEAAVAAEARERAERLAATVETLTQEMETRGRGRVVGASRGWRDAVEQVGRVASSETTVLITGESGTGTEVISNLLHRGSPRAGKPLVAINCAALPEQLLESELFGHEKGAFTGAIATKIGKIEQAAGGTLFLDEIAEMSPTVQAKFLRLLEQREFQRLGGTRTLRTDVRVVAATHRELSAEIRSQRFREDLYYRLNVFTIHLPPLRERPEDILLLADVFREDLGKTMGRPAAGISRDAREWLLAYGWPGNVRELKNAIERAILLCDGGLITRDHLPAALGRAASASSSHGNESVPVAARATDDVNLENMERDFLIRAMSRAKGNKSKAARLLGLTRAQLYWRLEKYGVD